MAGYTKYRCLINTMSMDHLKIVTGSWITAYVTVHTTHQVTNMPLWIYGPHNQHLNKRNKCTCSYKAQIRNCHMLMVRLLSFSILWYIVATTVQNEWLETWHCHSCVAEDFWDDTLCCWASGYRCSEGPQHLLLWLLSCFTPKIKALWSFRVSASTCPVTWHHIAKNLNPQNA